MNALRELDRRIMEAGGDFPGEVLEYRQWIDNLMDYSDLMDEFEFWQMIRWLVAAIDGTLKADRLKVAV